jgi:hypothetical protein
MNANARRTERHTGYVTHRVSDARLLRYTSYHGVGHHPRGITPPFELYLILRGDVSSIVQLTLSRGEAAGAKAHGGA